MLNFMKTMMITGLLAVGGGTVAVASGVDIVPGADIIPDQVQSIVFQQQEDGERPERPSDEEREAVKAFISDQVKPAVAELLGVTVEEVEAAKEDRTISELVEAAGLTDEEFRESMQAIKAEALDAAVAEGLLTAEQAEALANRQGKRGNRSGNSLRGIIDQEAAMATTADILGISVEELEQAREDGVRLPELVEELGLDIEEVKAELQVAKEAAIQQAVDDGTITQEEADALLNGEGRGRNGRNGRGGNRGPAGTDAPEGITNDNLDA